MQAWLGVGIRTYSVKCDMNVLGVLVAAASYLDIVLFRACVSIFRLMTSLLMVHIHVADRRFEKHDLLQPLKSDVLQFRRQQVPFCRCRTTAKEAGLPDETNDWGEGRGGQGTLHWRALVAC